MEKLNPFSPILDPISVNAEITLNGRDLAFRFALSDPQKLALDSLVPGIWKKTDFTRADLLWKTTCFEAFWAVPGEIGYWELNLAATGKSWNCYRFQDYRQPAPPVACFDFELQNCVVTESSMAFALRGKNDLETIEANLCVVIRTAKTTHYFSTAHAGEKPDFHLRGGFVLERVST